MNRLFGIVLALLLLGIPVAAVACSSGGPSLGDTEWRLASWAVPDVDPVKYSITLKFAGGRVSGFSGINTYSGPYKAGPGEAFEAGPLSGTLMAGSDEAMRDEAAYLSRLRRAATHRFVDSRLVLYDLDGLQSLVFEKTSP